VGKFEFLLLYYKYLSYLFAEISLFPLYDPESPCHRFAAKLSGKAWQSSALILLPGQRRCFASTARKTGSTLDAWLTNLFFPNWLQ
jgi:hypothetical protein